MEKNIRIFGKIVLIILCTLCFIWLIQKDETFFQLKQPAGEEIDREDAEILIQAAIEVMEEKDREHTGEKLQIWIGEDSQKDQTEVAPKEVLLYEDYSRLLEIMEAEKGTWQEEYTYKKQYRGDFYLLKEDWIRFFDAFLVHYGLSEKIGKEEVPILTGRENLTGESVGEGFLLTEKGEVVAYNSKEFENCYFTNVTAYVRKADSKRQKELLTVEKKNNKKVTLENVWVMEKDEEQVQFFYNGFEVISSLGKEKGNTELLREMVSDITFQEGTLIKIQQKTERVSGRLLRMNDTEMELEGSGTFKLTENVKIYQLYEELRECRSDDLRIGYDFADFVLEDGKICAALIMRKENMENIRVAIKNDGFTSLYHESLIFQADCDLKLIYGPYEERKTLMIAEGEEIKIEQSSEYLDGDRVELIPGVQSGKIQVSSLQRNQGIPTYRGRFEILDTEDGLVLINEVLLEEYLYSVVPSEMPASYPQEALKAQAVCARTYAYQYLLSPGLADLGAHVDDSVGYQVYNNIAENSNSTKAVKETMGELLFHEGEIVSTYYYSTSCGFGADAGVWKEENKEAMSYLVSRHISAGEDVLAPEDMTEEAVVREYLLTVNEDDFEAGEAWYRWQYKTEELDVEKMAERIKARYDVAPDKIMTRTEEGVYDSCTPELFTEIYEISVLKRREGGIVDELLIHTNKGIYKIISEYNVRYVLNAGGSVTKQDGTETVNGQLLPSAYIVIDVIRDGDIITGYQVIGGGYGHGVGMSQNGAKAMGLQGKKCEEILPFFYSKCEIKKMY